jgi:hypothetical protein
VKSKKSVGRRQNYEIARPDYECSDHVKKHSSVKRRGRKYGPSLAEIRERAFEIHIERGGILGCEPDDWLQAERELQEKYNKSNDGGPKKK